ncbi:ribonuclease H [Trifolium pratense]|uniref:Ribonuclease H n=1 Tax=Trifolium pratense TaxID=57577 RepID=A0A2K3NIM7_TRIPR|nr:ribonuclease H [Trifolium pratense]
MSELFQRVGTATTSVLVNGSPTDEFPFEKGLRQGDPLSPFLFLLATEGLHVLMEVMVERNLFTGYSVGDLAPVSVSHIQFADDKLLIGTKSWVNAHALLVVLVLFETMSGLKVNFNKNMLVGVNILATWLGEAASALCCRVGKISFIYLGLHIGGDPRRLSFWEPVLSRLKNRLFGWKSHFLSFGGRLVLLKLPTKANLVSRGILSQEAHHCVSERGVIESAQDVFLSCSTFGSLWSLVSSWIGSSLVTAQTILDHFVQFTSLAGGSRA